MEGFKKLVVMELNGIDQCLNSQSDKTKRLMNKRNVLTGVLIGVLGYSIYVQAIKIELLAKEIEDLKSEKGE